ncbi:TonB-dependent receptor [Alteriqipengyuania lutimaris]|uniref:TonB-dependent receptor n=1 Tax=Alteriqipengyuania lutimaris TaxID=1538146 RepID=A0A395LH54_9SPHN|nr:TonB-dependent receptor [Alteriqipengyuania lutimaris]
MALGSGGSLAAQDLEAQEIVVSGSRIEQDDYSDAMPAVGLRRPADFLVQSVVIRGDTRDQAERRREIRSMLSDAVRRASAAGVELAYGDYILTTLTPANLEQIALQNDNRPDSERVVFLVKARLAGTQSGEQAEAQIARFIESVPEVGRAQMDEWGDSTLSIVGPDSYRPQIAERIAQDSAEMARRMGDGYAVEVEGLNMPVQWARSGPGEVLLYIPYRLMIVPRP